MSWPLVAVKDVAKVVTGKTPSTVDDQNFGGDIPFVTPAELGLETYVTSAPRTLSAKGASAIKLVPKNAVMVCCIGSLGKMAIAGTPVATNQQINSVIFDESRVDAKYGFYALQLLKPKMEAMAPSTTIAIVNKGNFEAMEIPLPPLPEQKRIAAILDKADAIHRKRQQAIQLADDFLRAVFLDMFGDPVTNPKGWEVVPLRNHITFITSGGRGWSKYYSDSGARFIRSVDVQMNFIGDKDVAYVAPPDNAEAKRTKVECGDVLLTITGSRIGRVCVVPEKFETAFISQHVSLIRVDANLNPQYLSMFLSLGNGGQAQIAKAQYGQSKPGLNFEHIGDFKIPIPSKDEQDRFVDLWDKAIGISGRLAASEGSQMNLLNALSQKAFRGEL